MKLLKPTFLLILLFISLTSCQKDEIENFEEVSYTIDISLAGENDTRFSNGVLDLINEHRASIGLEALVLGSVASSAYAVDHTNYMIDLGQINHDNFAVRKAALENDGARIVGENVAHGYDTPEAVIHAWLNSSSHRANIEGGYTHTGFGIKYCEVTRTYFFTQLFYRL